MSTKNSEAVLAICIFSFVPVAIKFTAANPYTIGFFRLFVSTIFIYFWWKKKLKLNQLLTRESWRLILIGATFFCHWITYFYAIKIGGPQSCVLGMSTYGIQLIIYGAVILHYRLRIKNYLALFIVVLGLVQVLPSFSLSNNFSKGLLLGLISASFYSWMPILHQRFNRYFDYEMRIFSQFFFAFIFFSFFYSNTKWNLSFKDWGGLLFLAFFGTLIAHSLWAKVTSQFPTYVSGVIYYAITPMALFNSHLIFKESLSLRQVIGAIFIISGAIYNVWSSHDQYRIS